MAGVTSTTDEYDDAISRWTLVDDCVKGNEAIKNKEKAYLPMPNASDISTENEERYKQYLDRAVFYNVTSRTLRGLIGQVFTKEPDIQLPQLLELIQEDVDGGGVNLVQQAKKALAKVLALGRVGLLVDFPKTEGAISRADLTSGKIRPSIILYNPQSIINWRTDYANGNRKLSLVVIEETVVEDDDGFEGREVTQYRELRLVNNVYVVQLWRKAEKEDKYVVYDSYIPRDHKGSSLDHITFTFVGSENNDPVVDYSPLYDLAVLNIAHYRNSADYEESCYIVGQPTPYISGLSEHWVNEVLKTQIQLGARAAVALPEGGSMGLVQAAPNTMPFEAMAHKERQMVALGAKLIEQITVQRTATEARQEEASEVSVLSVVTQNVSQAYELCLEYAAEFLGPFSGKLVFQLNDDFDIYNLNAQERAQLISEWQSEAISFIEMRENLRRAGVAFLSDDEVKTEIESNPPGMGTPGLNDETTDDEGLDDGEA